MILSVVGANRRLMCMFSLSLSPPLLLLCHRLLPSGTSTLVPRLVIPRFACLPNGEWLCEDWCGRTARGLDWEDALKSTNERRRLSSLSPEAQ